MMNIYPIGDILFGQPVDIGHTLSLRVLGFLICKLPVSIFLTHK